MAVRQVLDYSVGFPRATQIKQAGFLGAIRYIGFPERIKCTTRQELDDFTANGIGMALVFQNKTDDWLGGYAAGVVNGPKARKHANDIGFPMHRPIYAAVDRDVVTPQQFATMLDYLRGFQEGNGGPGMIGVYGEADVVDRARQANVAGWFWQTKAWSGGRTTDAHLLQLIGTTYVDGIACDINNVLADDWGQHNAGDNDMDLWNFFVTQKWDALGNRNIVDGLAETMARTFTLDARTQAMAESMSQLVAAVTNDPDITQDQVKAIIDGAFANHPPVPVVIDENAMAQLITGLSDELESRGIEGATPEEVANVIRSVLGGLNDQ